MIEIRKAKQALKKYISNYDSNNDRIRVKIGHIERVAGVAKEIAKSLKLEEEDIKLAELIGLLHDIGRFEQVRRYDTFIDQKSVNHGELGVEILFEQGLIREFVEDTQYDEIIKKSILNHNRNQDAIQTTNERELLHSKIIRDADKIDIIYMLSFENKETAWGSDNIDKEKISEEIYREFKEEKAICYDQRKTAVDALVSHFAYVFDFNYEYALQIVKEKEYFKKIYERFDFEEKETQEKIDEIYKMVEEFLEKR